MFMDSTERGGLYVMNELRCRDSRLLLSRKRLN